MSEFFLLKTILSGGMAVAARHILYDRGDLSINFSSIVTSNCLRSALNWTLRASSTSTECKALDIAMGNLTEAAGNWCLVLLFLTSAKSPANFALFKHLHGSQISTLNAAKTLPVGHRETVSLVFLFETPKNTIQQIYKRPSKQTDIPRKADLGLNYCSFIKGASSFVKDITASHVPCSINSIHFIPE